MRQLTHDNYDYQGYMEGKMDELIKQREAEKAKLSGVIDRFAEEMKARAFQKVDEGYTGWDHVDGWKAASPSSRLLEEVQLIRKATDSREHQRRCVDAANFALFAWWLWEK